MKIKKLKFEQYRVRGKHREFDVLVFPKKKNMWAYYEDFDERYEIDGDLAAFQQVKYALATLIADPNKIVYFPIRGPEINGYYRQNYDAVLTRPELQFRRSEWVRLRRQLTKLNRIENFVLQYNPDRLCQYRRQFQSDTAYYKAMRQRKLEINTLLGDTVFLSPLKETCLDWLATIIRVEHYPRLSEPSEMIGTEGPYYMGNGLSCYFPSSEILGWILTGKSIWEMYNNFEDLRKDSI